jgi:hypothetical protein
MKWGALIVIEVNYWNNDDIFMLVSISAKYTRNFCQNNYAWQREK